MHTTTNNKPLLAAPATLHQQPTPWPTNRFLQRSRPGQARADGPADRIRHATASGFAAILEVIETFDDPQGHVPPAGAPWGGWHCQLCRVRHAVWRLAEMSMPAAQRL